MKQISYNYGKSVATQTSKRNIMAQTEQKAENVYKEFLNLPENVVGEIINGRLHTQPRPAPRHALALPIWARIWSVHTAKAKEVPADGGFFTNRKYIWEMTYLCRTLPDGKKRVCRGCPKRLFSACRRIGCAKSFPRIPQERIGSKKCRRTGNTASPTYGWSILFSKPWKHIGSGTDIGN